MEVDGSDDFPDFNWHSYIVFQVPAVNFPDLRLIMKKNPSQMLDGICFLHLAKLMDIYGIRVWYIYLNLVDSYVKNLTGKIQLL